MIRYIPNLLTLLRLFIAPIVLLCPPSWRFPLLFIGSFSDFFDGFLARRWSITSKFGVLVDPLADKLFVGSFAYLFWMEGSLSSIELTLLFSREIAVVLFVTGASLLGYWSRLTARAFWCGKIATTVQFFIFAYLCLGATPPFTLFFCIGAVSLLALFELPFNVKV